MVSFNNIVISRGDHIRQHGHRHAGALVAHLHDGQDGRVQVAAWGGLPARLHLLPDRDQPVRAPGPQDGQVAGLFDRSNGHWAGPHASEYLIYISW